MTHRANTAASASTSSGASSSPTAPSNHGIRSQFRHILPRHALFQVHLHIDQLSDVPLIKGEFGIRWKFKNVQSGSGLLSKMKGTRSWSAQNKGKEKAEPLGGSAEEGGQDEEDQVDDADSVHDSTHTFEDHPRDADGSFEHIHPPVTPTPVINGPSQSSTSLQSARSEARGITPWEPLQNYNVKWDHSVNVVVQMDVHREKGDLLPNELRLVAMQRVVPGDPDSPQNPRLGAVYLNLAEYADAGKITRRYLLRQSKTNATLKLTIELEHIGGEKHYKPPPLRKGEILASVAGILSNNGLFSTRFARELDLYVGSDKPEEDNKFPYANTQGHVEGGRLAQSYGLRTTEHLIEALFNPVPSDSSDQTPFTYYAPPPHRATPRSLNVSAVDTSNAFSDARRSIDSSIGSVSYVATASEHSGPEPGTVGDAGGSSPHRHWWQKMRSRPSTPASPSAIALAPLTDIETLSIVRLPPYPAYLYIGTDIVFGRFRYISTPSPPPLFTTVTTSTLTPLRGFSQFIRFMTALSAQCR